MKNRPKTARLRRDDWLEIGLCELGRAGPDALHIDPLCQAAGKTRGSFYHHFTDHGSFCREMLEHWYARHTARIIEEVEKHSDPSAKRHALSRLAAKLDQQVELAIRRLAATDAVARTIVERVDARRIAYLKEINAHEFQMAESDALVLAEIEYATFVGFQTLFPNAAERKYEAVGRQIDAMVKAAGRAGGSRGG